MLSPAIRAKVDALWDRFWSGGIANPLTAIEQISYLLFLKRLDAEDDRLGQAASFAGRPFTSIFAGHEDCRWSHFARLEGGEMLAHVHTRVFPFLKSLRPDDQPFARHMKDAVFLVPKPSLLVEAVGLLDALYDDLEAERQRGEGFNDLQGDLYEHLLSEIATSGRNGQFRTPRHIIRMMCGLVDPRLGEPVCDPACGTGGFLLGAFQHVLTRHTSPAHVRDDADGLPIGLVGDRLTDPRQWKTLREETFTGYDFDTTMVRIGLMNLILHGIDHPRIEYMDTLSKRFDEAGRYEVILANPPFKGSIDKGDIHEDLTLPTTKTELLFVDRILGLLRTGGRAGVIVPDGVLFGSSNAHRALRERLLSTTEVQAVVSLPSGVFKPYAGVSTAILVFVKGGRTDRVWFYDVTADGYSLDDKREKVAASDLPDVLARWRTRDPTRDTDRTAKAFFVPVDEIRGMRCDLSINRYRQVVQPEVSYEAPAAILGRLEALEAEIARDLRDLRGMVG